MNAAESTIVLTLDMETQRRLVAQVRDVMQASPLARGISITGQSMSVRMTSAGPLGWVADGGYRYTDRDAKGRPWPPMPDEWKDIAELAIGSLCSDPPHVGHVEWDSAIINWYDPGASLGWHVDKQEHDRTKPIVTISLGDAATWGIEVERTHVDAKGRQVVGWDRTRARLESGAVTVLAGPLRSASHTIERIISAPMFSPITDKKGAVVPGRISITLREAGRRNR
jgi:alkylated DNA repair protein (DNA oxidative demethylase)